MSDDKRVELAVLQAEQAGLVRVYFPNGSSFDVWLSRCFECRHHIDDSENPQPGRLTPPFNNCKWGVLDRIYATMGTDRYGYGTSFHPPEDVQIVEKFYPVCQRFTHRDDPNGETRDPPPPDCVGQMFLGDVVEPAPQPARATA